MLCLITQPNKNRTKVLNWDAATFLGFSFCAQNEKPQIVIKLKFCMKIEIPYQKQHK